MLRFFAFTCLLLSCFANASNITFYTEHYPPANFVEEGEVKGITVDTLKAIWQHLGHQEQEIVLAPWSRGYRFTLKKPNTALFTIGRTPTREELFHWVGPVFNSTYVLYAKKSKQLKFKNLGDVFYQKVATIMGDISEISLYQVGFPDFNMAKVTDLKQAFKMMESDKVNMVIASIHSFHHLSKDLPFNLDDYEIVWHVKKIGNYIAFNKETPADVLASYQKAFDSLEKERYAIKQKYDLAKEDY